jgi:L1 cell adhesion molecule like protein
MKATGGDSHLGGEDIDANMVQHFLKAIQRKYGTDLSNNVRARRRLKSACEVAKRSLSSKAEAILDLPSFLNGDDDYYAVVTKETLDEVNLELFQSTMDTVKKTLDDAKMDKNDIDQVLMVGGSSRILKLREMLTDFFGKGPNMSVNPDEVVACGAANQAAVLCGDLKKDNDQANVVLRDVTPLSLGTDTTGDVLNIVIPRNTPIPVTKCKSYITVKDDLTAATWNIYQGERKKASDNFLLGTLLLDGIPPAPCGDIPLEVTFSLDANGILGVTAKCTTTGKSQQTRITSGRLCRQEINKMVADAAKFKLVDDAFMANTAARGSLERYAYDTRFYPMDHQVDPRKQAVNRAVKQVLHWIDDHPHAMKEEFELKQQELEAEVESL